MSLIIASHVGKPCSLTIDVNFAINGYFHGNLYFVWLLSDVAMEDNIGGKIAISGKSYAMGPGIHADIYIGNICLIKANRALTLCKMKWPNI